MRNLSLIILFFSVIHSTWANGSYFMQQSSSCPDTALCDLTLNGGTLTNFGDSVNTWDVEISPLVTSLPVVGYWLCDTSFSVSYTAAILPLPDTTEIIVYCPNGDSIIYTINWNYAPSSNSLLDSLFFSEGVLCPEFNPDSLNYVLELDSLTAFTPSASALVSDSMATVVINSVNIPGEMSIVVTAEDGISTTAYTILIGGDCNLGIEEMNDLTSINLYPNPAKDIVNIHLDFSFSANISLVDLSGRVVQSIDMEEGQQDYQLDISKYPSGLYFIEVHLEGGLFQSEKLIIE